MFVLLRNRISFKAFVKSLFKAQKGGGGAKEQRDDKNEAYFHSSPTFKCYAVIVNVFFANRDPEG